MLTSANYALIGLGALSVVEAIICLLLLKRIDKLQARVARAVRTAEDAARAAALASPGGIDPEIVIGLLRSGMPVTLDAVYERMHKDPR